jgi:hypothetical protein
MWTKVRFLTGKDKIRTPASSHSCSPLSTEDFNSHYSGQSTDKSYVESSFKLTAPSSDYLAYFSEFIVFHALDTIKSTSPGPDGLPSWFLKISAPSLYSPLTYLFNLSILSGIVPTRWEKATIKPIPEIS